MERTEQLYHGMHSATVVIKIIRVLHFLQQVDPLLTLDHVTLTEEQAYVSYYVQLKRVSEQNLNI